MYNTALSKGFFWRKKYQQQNYISFVYFDK